MRKFVCIQEWKGSPTGATTERYLKDQVVTESDLGTALAEIAEKAGFIKEQKEEPKGNTLKDLFTGREATLQKIIDALPTLDREADFTKSGKPDVKAIEKAIGENISAAERDAVWEAYTAAGYGTVTGDGSGTALPPIEEGDMNEKTDQVRAITKGENGQPSNTEVKDAGAAPENKDAGNAPENKSE